MPKIAEGDQISYGGAVEKITRLGLKELFDELIRIITGFKLLVKEQKDSNGGKTLRKMIDDRFQQQRGWSKKVTGDIDWTKCLTVNGTKVCIGVELQMSGRSDLVIVDLIHLRRGFTSGVIDVGVLVVANDQLGLYLTDRVARLKDAKHHIKEAKIEDLPIILIGIGHDGAGPPLPKQSKRKMKLPEPRSIKRKRQ